MTKAKPKKNLLVIEQIGDAQEIAEVQLNRLKELSRNRPLSYEEVKIFDLLTKNLLLIKHQDNSISTTSTNLPASGEETKELLKIADMITEDHAAQVLNKAQDEQLIGSESGKAEDIKKRSN